MNLSVDQIKTLESVARLGSVSSAARELGRVPSAILYQMGQLEDAVGLTVFDRTGYRTGLTLFGRRLLEQCAPILTDLARVGRFCETARLGYEPTLSVVFDGLLPVRPFLAAVRAVAASSPDTRVSLFSEYLSGVEELTHKVEADIAVALIPFASAIGSTFALEPVISRLVVAAPHPLASHTAPQDLLTALARHTLLTVRGSDPRLGLLPPGFKPAAELRLSDFAAKKEALLAGMGWGWMPEHLVIDELRGGGLVQLIDPAAHGHAVPSGEHVFSPTLHLRRHGHAATGHAATVFLKTLGIRPPG
jgi:DNA-binding transcriptional LysR family regulator